ncbi:hypothetical protein MKW92_007503, partial [Papaver armeniacum]
GLGPDYQAFSTAIETRSTLPTFSELKPLLLNHEVRLTQYNHPISESTPSTAFYGSTFSSSSSTNFSPSRGGYNSNRGGYNSFRGGRGGNNGRGYRGGARGAGGRGRSGYFANPTHSFGNQFQQQQSILGAPQQQSILGAPPTQLSGTKCQICESKAHTALTCGNRFNHAFQSRDLPQSFA